jgi:hypothetical protein
MSQDERSVELGLILEAVKNITPKCSDAGAAIFLGVMINALGIKIVYPEDGVESPYVYLVDDQGHRLCRVNYDDPPDEVLENVASAICGAAGIEFQGFRKTE